MPQPIKTDSIGFNLLTRFPTTTTVTATARASRLGPPLSSIQDWLNLCAPGRTDHSPARTHPHPMR